MTYATAYSNSMDDAPPKAPAKKVVKKGVNGVAKKKREVSDSMSKRGEPRRFVGRPLITKLEVAGIIDTLPLEYRGRDPVSVQKFCCDRSKS